MGEAGTTEVAPMAQIGTFPGVQSVTDLMTISRDFLLDGVYGRKYGATVVNPNRIGPR